MNLLADENVDRLIVERLRQDPERKGEIVVETINKHGTELLNAFSVVTIGAIRIRHEID